MRVETKIQDLMEVIMIKTPSLFFSVVGDQGSNPLQLLDKNSSFLSMVPNDFLGEILLLSRGPMAFSSADKGIMGAVSLRARDPVSQSFNETLILRACKKLGFLPA